MPRIWLTALLAYAAVGFLADRGEKLLVPENLQPVKSMPRLSSALTTGLDEEYGLSHSAMQDEGQGFA